VEPWEDDYTIIDSNLNTTPPIGLAWLRGDSNLDGIVTGDDYTTIDSNLGLGTSNPLSPASLGTSSLRIQPLSFGGGDASLSALSGASTTVVPEPSVQLGLFLRSAAAARRARASASCLNVLTVAPPYAAQQQAGCDNPRNSWLGQEHIGRQQRIPSSEAEVGIDGRVIVAGDNAI
jgi:hypothetical protein